MPYYLKIPLMTILSTLCSDPQNFLKEVTKKIRKIQKKIFCYPSKIQCSMLFFNDIQYLAKKFCDPCKNTPAPRPMHLMYGPYIDYFILIFLSFYF